MANRVGREVRRVDWFHRGQLQSHVREHTPAAACGVVNVARIELL
jgi:hypothetical protein